MTGTDADKETTLTRLETCSERVRGLKRKLDDLQPAPGAPGAAVLRDRLTHIDGALLAPAHAREAEKEAERARDLAILAGKTEQEEKKDEKEGEDGDEAMEVDEDADEKDREMAKAKARAKAVVAEHFEKKSTSSAGAALDTRADGDSTVDRYIIDHLLRTGRMKTAKTLAASQGIEVS